MIKIMTKNEYNKMVGKIERQKTIIAISDAVAKASSALLSDYMSRVAELQKQNDEYFARINELCTRPKKDKGGRLRNSDGTFARKK